MPPKAAPKVQAKVSYPAGVKEITDDLGTDELVRRLKACAQAFQNMGQDDNNQEYIALAMHLAQDQFLEHTNKDVRLLVACCVADVFRVYAPEAPYKEPEHLKNIFLFFIKQLRGLEDPKDAAFKRYFYLLENLAWVKSFNICIELEENQDIFCKLFTLMFQIVNDEHSTKVKNFMLDVMNPLISEADTVSQELLDIILANIIDPRKSQNRNAYNLARDLLTKTSSTIEPYIQAFFNNALILGKPSESDVACNLYDLIYELNAISPSVLLAVLPQLEFKLKSNDEKERLEVTRLLARMFSDKNSELATQHKSLWTCFLGRFNDISVGVRNRCVQYSMHFLLNHPELRKDITEQLKLRQHDPEESVRYEVVMAIISAAKREFSSITDELLEFVKERTLDKKFKIRKEALVGLSMIYKRCMNTPDVAESTRKCVSWIKDKVLHVYYQTALEDRLLVERILHTCLVPYQLPPAERVKKLYQLYATVDDHAVKAFNELLKCQNTVRSHVRGLLELQKDDRTEDIKNQITTKTQLLSKSLPEPVKALEYLKKFEALLASDGRVRHHLEVVMKLDCACKDAEDNVRELLKRLGNPVMTNVFYMTVKQLLERVAPVLIDRHAVHELLILVEQVLNNVEGVSEEIGEDKVAERGLKLLHTLSFVFPGSFLYPDVYNKLIDFLQLDNANAAELTLQIWYNIGQTIESDYPEIAEKLLEILIDFAVEGTGKQAKHAIRCLNVITEHKEQAFGRVLENIKTNLNLDSNRFRTGLISMGHIAFNCPELFFSQLKSLIFKHIVQELLMQDKEDSPRDTDCSWCDEHLLSEETKAKLAGMKVLVRWLLGLKSKHNVASNTLRLLSSVVEQDGDLLNKGNVSRPDKAWLRLTAGCCILKLCQVTAYADVLSARQFQVVSKLINDDCYKVREIFAQKLHKGLIALKLPLDFMAIFALGINENNKELRTQLQQYLLANINKRRDYLKQQSLSNRKMLLYLPDYVLPYAIHLLAHSEDFKSYDMLPILNHIRDSLWFIMEPLIIKNDNYSFGFLKKMLENIKQTKDALNPDDNSSNQKLWAVSDLALGLIMSKTSNFVCKEFPVEPNLPNKLYTKIDTSFVNSTIFLPPELMKMFPKGTQLDGEQNKAGRPAGANGTAAKRPRQMRASTLAAQAQALAANGGEAPPIVSADASLRIVSALTNDGTTLQEEEEEVPADEMEETSMEPTAYEVVTADAGDGEAQGEETSCPQSKRPRLQLVEHGNEVVEENIENIILEVESGGQETMDSSTVAFTMDPSSQMKDGLMSDATVNILTDEHGNQIMCSTILVPANFVQEQQPINISQISAIKHVPSAGTTSQVETSAAQHSQSVATKPDPTPPTKPAGRGRPKGTTKKVLLEAKTTRLNVGDAAKQGSDAQSNVRTSTRNASLRQASRSDASSDSKDSDTKETSQKTGDKPVAKKSATAKPTAVVEDAPLRRNLRRAPSLINGSSKTSVTSDSDEIQDSNDSSPRKSVRGQTRAPTPTPADVQVRRKRKQILTPR